MRSASAPAAVAWCKVKNLHLRPLVLDLDGMLPRICAEDEIQKARVEPQPR